MGTRIWLTSDTHQKGTSMSEDKETQEVAEKIKEVVRKADEWDKDNGK
jgi:hypothetical protein